MQKNIEHAQRVSQVQAPAGQLRRQPPSTLEPEVEPYPKDLLALKPA